jgi:hypothetical protein
LQADNVGAADQVGAALGPLPEPEQAGTDEVVEVVAADLEQGRGQGQAVESRRM